MLLLSPYDHDAGGFRHRQQLRLGLVKHAEMCVSLVVLAGYNILGRGMTDQYRSSNFFQANLKHVKSYVFKSRWQYNGHRYLGIAARCQSAQSQSFVPTSAASPNKFELGKRLHANILRTLLYYVVRVHCRRCWVSLLCRLHLAYDPAHFSIRS